MLRDIDTRKLVQYAVFVSIIMLMGLTPWLGYIPLFGVDLVIVHLPVIIGGYLFSTKGGALLGFFYGLTSLVSSFIAPDMISVIVLGTNTGFGLYNLFLIIVILFLPRILTGVFAALTYQALRRVADIVAMGVAAVVGSLTNTVLLLGGLYVFAFPQTGAAMGLATGFTSAQLLNVLFGIVTVNGLLEAVAALIICTAVGKALVRLFAMPLAKRPRPDAQNNVNVDVKEK
ncbi:MAG: ECF transporter S component [Clostridiales bacterium]|jgi:uncharacterized membrane protein|nr:ECF transporter S component [Clostridiales bacterium]